MSRKTANRRGPSQGRHLFEAAPQPHTPASPERIAEFMKTLQAGRRSSLTEPEMALADAALLRRARASPVTRASPVAPRVTPPARAETRERIARIKKLRLEASNRQIAKTII
jgi:hypothetical protein